jgi:hypothetical protein
MTGFHDLNDPEIVESLKYLQISPAEKIRLQALPFDGKKQCWVPDTKDAFVSGDIEKMSGEEAVVKTSKGEV